MHRLSPTTVLAAVLVGITVALLFPTSIDAHNITHILAKNKEFSTFNRYLSETHLAGEINSRETITVLAVDDSAMSDLIDKHLSISAIKNVLAVHVLLDYFDAKKLHQISHGSALAATVFQATGAATGSAGFVNITDLKGGKVGFAPQDNNGSFPATFVKSVEEIPYNISVIQISRILPLPEAEAPGPAPTEINITNAMSSHGCKVFAETLLNSSAEKTFEDNVNGGLTIFCPGDDAMKKFLPEFKNLTSDEKQSLLEFHGVPVYHSLSDLRSNNGDSNTLATDSGNNYAFTVQNDGDVVTLKTKLVKAKITGTLIDEQPLAIFSLDKVLMPKELFKGAAAPAPAPDSDAEPPKPGKGHKPKSPPAPEAPSDSPADAPSPDSDVDDQTSDNSSAIRFNGGTFVAMVLSLFIGFSL